MPLEFVHCLKAMYCRVQKREAFGLSFPAATTWIWFSNGLRACDNQNRLLGVVSRVARLRAVPFFGPARPQSSLLPQVPKALALNILNVSAEEKVSSEGIFGASWNFRKSEDFFDVNRQDIPKKSKPFLRKPAARFARWLRSFEVTKSRSWWLGCWSRWVTVRGFTGQKTMSTEAGQVVTCTEWKDMKGPLDRYELLLLMKKNENNRGRWLCSIQCP